MKRGKKGKKRKIKRSFISSKVRKTLPYQLLIISLIVLVILIILWVVLFILGKISYLPKEDGVWTGELGALSFWDSDVVLSVLNYNKTNENQTIQVNINYTSGTDELDAILVEFEGDIEVCNYTISSGLIGVGENQTYEINYSNTTCNEENFTDTYSIYAYPGIDVVLNQTQNLTNITMDYKNENLTDVLYLNHYFECNVDDLEFLVSDGINVSIVVVDDVVGFYPDFNWSGEERITIDVSCVEEETSDSFYFKVLNAIRPDPILNNAPEFISDECYEFEWEVNNNFTFDMDYCWEDEDGEDEDNLILTYGSLQDYKENISIILESGNKLKFVPNASFTGRTYLYIYADDSKDKSGHRVYINISLPVDDDGDDGDDGDDAIDSTTLVFNIQTPLPSGDDVSLFIGESRTFSIANTEYDSIKWFLDGIVVSETGGSYEVEDDLEVGEHILKVEITKDGDTKSKTWDLIIEKEGSKISIGKIIFYAALVIILIIIMLIVWLFIAEKNAKNRKINYMGFGVSGPSIKIREAPKNRVFPAGTGSRFDR